MKPVNIFAVVKRKFEKNQGIAEPEVYEAFVDGLRGAAILMVLAFHTIFTVQGAPHFKEFPDSIEHLSRGVQLFFIISAFTLTKSARLRWISDKRPLLSFYIRRSFRILPLWWLAVILYYFFGSPKHSVADALATAFFYFGFFGDAWSVCLIAGGWSLFVEETFYVFFPLWQKYVRNISAAIVALVISVFGAWYWDQKSFQLFTPESHLGAISPLANYFAFFIGITLFHLRKELLSGKISTLSGYFLDAAALGGFILIFFSNRIVGTFALVPFFIAAFFPSTFSGRLTRSPLFIKFGLCCYSIYLFHGLLGQHLYSVQWQYFRLLGMLGSGQEVQSFFWFFPYAGISLVIGLLSFHFFERPCVNLGKRVLASWPK